jgi:hypothetical protein
VRFFAPLDSPGLPEVAFSFSLLARQIMALAARKIFDLAFFGQLKSLGHSLFGF